MTPLFMLFAIIFAAVFVGVLIFSLRRQETTSNNSTSQMVREKLARVESEIAAGRTVNLFNEADAADASLEAKHSLLANASAAKSPERGENSKAGLIAMVLFIGLAPILAAGIYFRVGTPDYLVQEITSIPDTPASSIAKMPAEERTAAIGAMVDGLAARLAENPNDPPGWRMLARSQSVLGRTNEAIESLRRLTALDGATLDDWKSLAAALAAVSDEGPFPTSVEFLSVLDAIDRINPDDPFARFYQAGAALRSGEPARAREIWRGLLSELPEEAPGRDLLQSLISQAEIAEKQTTSASDDN